MWLRPYVAVYLSNGPARERRACLCAVWPLYVPPPVLVLGTRTFQTLLWMQTPVGENEISGRAMVDMASACSMLMISLGLTGSWEA